MADADEYVPVLLDDQDQTTFQRLLDQYKDPPTFDQALTQLQQLIQDHPVKFFRKLAAMFKLSNDVTIRASRLSDLHFFMIRSLGQLAEPIEIEIKGVILEAVRIEEDPLVISNLCKFISNLDLHTRRWAEAVSFVYESLSKTVSTRLQKIALTIIGIEPRILVKAIRPRKDIAKHGELCERFDYLLSGTSCKTTMLALKAVAPFIVCLEARYRKYYKTLIPKFRVIMHRMVTLTGPRVQTSVLIHDQKFVEAAEVIELFLGMDNLNFFITDVSDTKKFVGFLLYLARTRPFFPRLRKSAFELVAKFCLHQHIHMENHYLGIYLALHRMMIEINDPSKWYQESCADRYWAGDEYCSALLLLDNFVPAGISVDAFLKAAECEMRKQMVPADWCDKHAVMVVVAKLADSLFQEKEGTVPSDNLKKLLELARLPLTDTNGRLLWASATAIGNIGLAMKKFQPRLIKEFANGVISDLQKASENCDAVQAQAAIKTASVVFLT